MSILELCIQIINCRKLQTMRKIIIPIDFSRSSNNAINFAVALSHNYPLEQIILVINVYVTEFEKLMPSADFIQYSMDKAAELDNELKHQFADIKHSLLNKLKKRVRVSFILSEIPFLQSLKKLILQEQPDMMLIGSNHGVSGEESYIGDHLIKIAKASTIPVLVIPQLARYHELKHVLVPFDVNTITTLSLIRKMDRLKDFPHPELFFLNINQDDDNQNEEQLRKVAKSFAIN